jgi:hypothetical protein
LILSGLATIAALSLAAYPLVGSGNDLAIGETLCALVALAAVAAALLKERPAAVAWLLLGFGLEFLIHDLTDGLPIAGNVLYTAGLLLLCELISAASLRHGTVFVERAVHVQQAVTLAGVTLAAALVALLVLLFGTVRLGSSARDGVAATTLGVLGITGLLALILRLQKRVASPSSRPG